MATLGKTRHRGKTTHWLRRDQRKLTLGQGIAVLPACGSKAKGSGVVSPEQASGGPTCYRLREELECADLAGPNPEISLLGRRNSLISFIGNLLAKYLSSSLRAFARE
jgi:hypothetical protein